MRAVPLPEGAVWLDAEAVELLRRALVEHVQRSRTTDPKVHELARTLSAAVAAAPLPTSAAVIGRTPTSRTTGDDPENGSDGLPPTEPNGRTGAPVPLGEIAERTGVPARTLRSWALDGKLPGARLIGRVWVAPLDAADGRSR